MSQEDVIHLLRELYHADIISALSADTLFMGITRIDNSAWPAFDWQERQESVALHTKSQEDGVHLIREHSQQLTTCQRCLSTPCGHVSSLTSCSGQVCTR